MKPFSRKPQTSSSPRPCASSDETRIRLNGLELVPDLSGALYAPDLETLIVADLHLEKGSAFAARGVHLPPYDTGTTLAALDAVRTRLKPRHIVSLGDSFHDDRARERLHERDIARIRALSDACEMVWVTGNHDRAPPDDLGGRIVEALRLGDIVLRHEPSSGLALEAEIAGHLHPVASLVRRGRKVRRRCFAGDAARLVLPSFGAFTGGLDVRSQGFSGVFPSGRFTVWMLGREAVYALPSRALF